MKISNTITHEVVNWGQGDDVYVTIDCEQNFFGLEQTLGDGMWFNYCANEF